MADNTNQNNSDGDMSFAVMPKEANGGNLISDEPGSVPVPVSDIVPEHAEEEPGHGKYFYIVGSLLILLALGAMAYFLLWGKKQEGTVDANPDSRLPKVFLQEHFGAATCESLDVCGDKADPDSDGLSNYDEFVEQTDPKDKDTDKDGLADGDEVKIYLTNPIKKFTDPRKDSEELGYHDGSQIKNEYDPLTPGLKMTEVRKAQINADKERYGLHEPTTSTLFNPVPQPKTVTVSIVNGKFDPPNITVSLGDTVTWVNKDTASHQIASDPHPDHSDHPDLESGLVATSQTYSYKFTEPGVYNYHDHLSPGIKAVVTVAQ